MSNNELVNEGRDRRWWRTRARFRCAGCVYYLGKRRQRATSSTPLLSTKHHNARGVEHVSKCPLAESLKPEYLEDWCCICCAVEKVTLLFFGVRGGRDADNTFHRAFYSSFAEQINGRFSRSACPVAWRAAPIK